MDTYDIMYHVSKQLVDIVKPMIQNEFHEAKDLEDVQANYGDIQSPTFHKVGSRANIMHALFNKANQLLHGYGLNRSMVEES